MVDDSARGPANEEPPSALAEVGLALLVVTGYASPLLMFGAGLVIAVSRGVLPLGILGGLAALVGWLALVVRVRRSIREDGARGYRIAGDILVLAILPAWGLFYGYTLAEQGCTRTACDGNPVYRPFSEPEVYGLIALHAAIAVAYAVSRRRPEALRSKLEVVVLAALAAGVIVHATIAVHFGKWVFFGLVFPPVFFPCAAPLFTVVLYASELRGRLRRRGREATLARGGSDVAQVPYRQNQVAPQRDAPFEVHRGLLLRAIALSPMLLGLHAVVQALWLGRPTAALDVLTRTCGYTLSRVPIEIIPADCHYLCTVAARGHTWLVRPERQGRRRGVPILVNRQLAVANAFEDLLHERWPRFGRLARRVYDRLGLPVSRYIRSRWLADVVYLAMKPLEYGFLLVLLLLDRQSPEARIDRMYR